jgi:hypothetical protein
MPDPSTWREHIGVRLAALLWREIAENLADRPTVLGRCIAQWRPSIGLRRSAPTVGSAREEPQPKSNRPLYDGA